MLSHYWTLNDKTTIQTNVAYQTGHIGNSRIGYYKAQNPDPTYYQNLPSYALAHNAGPDYQQYYDNLTSFKNYGQVDWDGIYQANFTNNGNSAYYLYEDRNDDTTISVNTNLTTELTDNITLNGRVNYSKLKSENYANMLDLLGSKHHVDIDAYAQIGTAAEQYNFDNPNREIKEGDRFNYNYNIYSSTANAFAQLQFAYDKVDFFVSGNFTNTSHQREGLYKNGAYLNLDLDNPSLGKGKAQVFNDMSFKGGLTYKITGRHLLNVNAGMLSVAPNLRQTFFNSRANNLINPDITSQKITSFDASYIYRGPGIKARLTGYMTTFKDGVESAFYYAEGIKFSDEISNGGNDFVGEMTTGVDKLNKGIEFGMEIQVTPTIKLTSVASLADFRYTSNPFIYLTDEGSFDGKEEYGTTYLKNYKIGGTAQQAYSLGFEYRDPNYWWFGVNGNYIADNYINVTKLIRTDRFYRDSDNNGAVFINPETGDLITEKEGDALLTQEEFDPVFLLNAVGGKSWKIGDKYIGFFANISNILGRDYKTGGFEQARKANFIDLQKDKNLETPIFGSKYWYGNKTTYYLNLYLRF
ncbi:MAG TPA: TonB-dependent receptor [Archaeoglobus profundus]|nr:TonB-dependent receptor [Archaeoglobus profundus]